MPHDKLLDSTTHPLRPAWQRVVVTVLAHQPKFINSISNTSNIDLILCGHTHGGQIFPFNFLVKLDQPYVKGLNIHNESTQVYVNKGTGFWGPPMRLGASSEITILNLKEAKA